MLHKLILVALLLIAGPVCAQVAITGPGGTGASPSPLGVWADLDTNGNIATVYPGPQPQNPATEFFPVNDARVQAFYAASSARGPVPTGAKSQ